MQRVTLVSNHTESSYASVTNHWINIRYSMQLTSTSTCRMSPLVTWWKPRQHWPSSELPSRLCRLPPLHSKACQSPGVPLWDPDKWRFSNCSKRKEIWNTSYNHKQLQSTWVIMIQQVMFLLTIRPWILNIHELVPYRMDEYGWTMKNPQPPTFDICCYRCRDTWDFLGALKSQAAR